MNVSDDDFFFFSKYIFDLTGMELDICKKYLFETRFLHLISEYRCKSLKDLYLKSIQDQSKFIPNRIIDAITTHETSFFRDKKPFEIIRQLISDRLEKNLYELPNPISDSLDIWSVACSTGQEVYSVAMTAKETLGRRAGKFISILGTDISDECISKASYGKYTKFEVERGLSPVRIKENFYQSEDSWKIKDELRAMATFKKLNLMDKYYFHKKFDIILCRNVAIYFSLETKKDLFDRLADYMWNNAILILGSTETLIGVTNRYMRMENEIGVYYQLAQ